MKESGVHAVKVEGGAEVKDSVLRIFKCWRSRDGAFGFNATVHLQVWNIHGACQRRRSQETLWTMPCCFKSVAFGIVLEKFPLRCTRKFPKLCPFQPLVLARVRKADGQSAGMKDMLGITKNLKTRFLGRYADLDSVVTDAVKRYIKDVKAKDFPNKEEMY